MRHRLVLPVAVALVCLGACSAGNPTANSGLTLPAPDEPDTLLPSINVTDPPDITQTLPKDAMFGGDICSALTAADLARVFNGARLADTTLLAVDTCRYLVGTGSREIDVRVGLSSIDEFTAPQVRDVSDVGPTIPTSPPTEKTTDIDIPNTSSPPEPSSTTPPGSAPSTTEPVAGPPPEVEELSGVGLGIRGLQQGRFYEVYVKVENGFFTLLAPTKADAIALARLAVPRATRG